MKEEIKQLETLLSIEKTKEITRESRLTSCIESIKKKINELITFKTEKTTEIKQLQKEAKEFMEHLAEK